ncbi:MAG: hypothetical protein J6B12_02605 [Clostridia bacterium]|nr:hypothetical protein [Clostridia bacterium]
MNGNNVGGDIRIENKFLSWLDNFWYHYKWRTIGALFIAFVLTVCITQCATKEKTDVVVMYAGPYLYTSNETLTVKDELREVMPSDFNGDGEKIPGLVTYQIMTDEQLKAYKAQLELYEDHVAIDTSYFTTQASNCNNYLLTGECAILLIDESLFQKLKEADRLRRLDEMFPNLPASAIDEYGIDFTKTALAKNAEQLGKLPEGTVLCLLRPYVMGNISDSTTYSQITNMFAAMARD